MYEKEKETHIRTRGQLVFHAEPATKAKQPAL